MAKKVFTVNAMQSDANGNFTTVSGFPKRFSSDSYQTDDPVKTANKRAKSSYHAQISAFYAVDNIPLWTVTLENEKGQQIMPPVSEGDFPSAEPEEETEEQ